MPDKTTDPNRTAPTANEMRPWHPEIDTLRGLTDPAAHDDAIDIRDEVDIDQLLWNALEPNPVYPHPEAAAMLRAVAVELAANRDRIAYLPAEDIAFHAKAAATRISNAGLATHVIGDAVTTAQVRDFLSISQRELAQLIIDDKLVFVHDVWETARLFPRWQFDLANRTIRSEVAAILHGFAGTSFHRQRFALLNWMTQVTPGDLPGDLSPVEWVEAGYDFETLIGLVNRVADGLVD